MNSLAAILKDAAVRLAPVTDTPRLDAELLLAHTLGWNRAQLLAHLDGALDEGSFGELLARRLQHEPVAYILGDCEFFSIPLKIRPPILIPRPETEHLVEVALAFAGDRSVRVLDLCTGSGCVAIAIARNAPNATVNAIDINPEAVTLSRENLRATGVNVALHEGDLFDALPDRGNQFDIITANPPYVETSAWQDLAADIRDYESPLALVAGEDGLDIVRRIVSDARSWLVPGGLLAMEIGETQFAEVATLLSDAGYDDVRPMKDLAGIQRIALANMSR